MLNSHATLTEAMLQDTALRRPCCSGKVLLMCFFLIGSGIQLSFNKQLFTAQDPATNLDLLQLDDLEQSLIKLYEEQRHEINQLHARMDVNRPSEFSDQATDFAKMKHLTTIMPLGLNRVYLNSSHVHGQGVFASCNISAGEVVTFYPADIVTYSPQGKQPGVRALFPSKRLQDVLGQTPNALQDSYCTNKDYMLGASTSGLASWSITGDPRFNSNADYMGHFVNDAAKCGRSERAEQAYESEKIHLANCKYVVLKKELHVAIVATKNVAKK